MPRTKRAPLAAKNADVSAVVCAVDSKAEKQLYNSKIRIYLRDVESQYKKQIKELESQQDALKSAVKLIFREKNFNMLPVLRNKTLAELEAVGLSSTNFVTLSEASSVNSLMITSTVRKVHQKKRSLSLAEDEGYLTAEGNDAARSKRQSRATGKKPATAAAPKTTRRTRSLSKSKIKSKDTDVLNSLCTPLNKGPPPESFGMVTPKMKPNTPQVILRRPKEGEMAISMQGSPLMVNPVVTTEPNVNIPLDDGRTISIQPKRGLRMSQLPHMDNVTLSRLQVLRDNLIKMCELTK